MVKRLVGQMLFGYFFRHILLTDRLFMHLHLPYMVFVYILAAMMCYVLAVLLAHNRVTGEMVVDWFGLSMLMT
jgi:hypothetical protein